MNLRPAASKPVDVIIKQCRAYKMLRYVSLASEPHGNNEATHPHTHTLRCNIMIGHFVCAVLFGVANGEGLSDLQQQTAHSDATTNDLQ